MKILFNFKSKKSLLFLTMTSFVSFSQTNDTIKSKDIALDEVLISAIRVTQKSPIAFSNLSKKEISTRNLGQDIPILMNYLPSVVTTSDAGSGVGYTGIRVRGTDASRVNVTLNGIPYNDSESQGTFWVNLVDIASSTQSIQLQRGVGTSTNGSSAFGASLNLLTDSYSYQSNGEISNSYGSFNTRKNTVKFSTGLINNNIEIAGRFSTIYSDGYIDRAFSDLKGYFLQGTYIEKSTLIKALVFGGKEKTYQAWNGIDGDMLKTNRRFNSAGIYTDSFGNERFYDNEVDDYQQDHFQLHWNEKWNNKWSSNIALHYTKGKGFYENYKENARFSSYGLTPINNNGIIIDRTNLVRQKWLDNDFYGITYSANYKSGALDLILGGSINQYIGEHFGKVIWARYASQSELNDKYYQDDATKNDASYFAKANYVLNDKFSVFGDLQYRRVNYKANGVRPSLVDDTFNFINPKAGVTYNLLHNNILYLSYAKGSREPNRNDYEGGNFKPEKLNDFELGWRLNTTKVKLNTNVYYMVYKDQLILTGELDDVGNPERSNSEKSYRLGIELDADIQINNKFSVRPNVTFSQNNNVDLVVNNINYGTRAISYSPSVVAGNLFIYEPSQKLNITLLSKFVGDQYMNNLETPEAKLESYFVSDLNISYQINTKKIFKSIVFNGLVNNIFNKEYVSNGYMYDVYPYYYPQAGINFLTGVTFKF